MFFKVTPLIEVINGRRVHVFECNAKCCVGKGNGRMVRRYLDTSDAKSTGNLRKHAKGCWGDEVVAAADATKNVQAARDALEKVKSVDGSITAAFQRIAKDKITYSHRQLTAIEARYASLSLPPSPLLMVLTTPLVRSSFVGSQRASDPSRL